MGDAKLVDTMIVDGLWDVYNQYHMGVTAENVAKKHEHHRARSRTSSRWRSQNKAEKAQKAGAFKDEITPVMIPQRKGDPVAFDADEFIKAGTTLDSISGLRPAFAKEGSVTAANASGINDGAAAVLVMTAERAAQAGPDAAREDQGVRDHGRRSGDHGHGSRAGVEAAASRRPAGSPPTSTSWRSTRRSRRRRAR